MTDEAIVLAGKENGKEYFSLIVGKRKPYSHIYDSSKSKERDNFLNIIAEDFGDEIAGIGRMEFRFINGFVAYDGELRKAEEIQEIDYFKRRLETETNRRFINARIPRPTPPIGFKALEGLV